MKSILTSDLRPAGNLLQSPVSLAESLLYSHPVPVRVTRQTGEGGKSKVKWVAGLVGCRHGRFVPQRDVVVLRLVGEDVERHLRPLLLDVLDEESDLHGSSDIEETPLQDKL